MRLSIIIVLFSLLSLISHAQAPDRTVELTLTFKDHTGAPLRDLPVRCATKSTVRYSLTSAGGQAIFSINLGPDESCAFVRFEIDRSKDDESSHSVMRLLDLQATTAIPNVLVVPIASDQLACSKEFTFSKARHVKLRCLEDEPEPFEALLTSLNWCTLPLRPSGGVSRGQGFPSDACTAYLIFPGLTSELIPLELHAGDQDLDLGDVRIHARDLDASLRVRFTNVEALDQRVDGDYTDVYLISTDGKIVVDGRDPVVNSDLDDQGRAPPTKVPSGEYWVSPCTQFGLTTVTLLELVRSGVDLSNSGIPKITIAPGELLEPTIDAASAQAAILKAGRVCGF